MALEELRNEVCNRRRLENGLCRASDNTGGDGDDIDEDHDDEKTRSTSNKCATKARRAALQQTCFLIFYSKTRLVFGDEELGQH